MVNISILGTGHLAKHLFDAFAVCADVEIVQVIGRNAEALKTFGSGMRVTSDFSKIWDADIFIIAVQDDAIATVSGYLEDKKGLIVHTSGSVSMDVLSEHERHGVFYPLQTFSRNRKVDMTSVPFCVETHADRDLALLKNLAGNLSEKVYEVDSEQRRALHLAAVFANNFTNHLYHIGQQICKEEGLPFGMLHPLIRETVDKIEDLEPYNAQTGPARRGDSETLEKHLEQLKNKNTEYRKVYKILSESILNLYDLKDPQPL